MKIGLLVLIGIPGSGKTTLAKTLINNYQNHDTIAFHFIQISYDEHIPVENQSVAFEWKSARHLLSLKIEKLIESIKTRDVETCPEEFKNQLLSVKIWDSSFVVIVDDNMYFKSMRYSLFQIARRQNIGYCQVYIHCPLQCAVLRNSKRSECIIPTEVIEKMYGKMEPPDFKNNWEKYSVQLGPDLSGIGNILIPVLSSSLDNYFHESEDNEERTLSKLESRKSVLHQVDIALRKVIGCRIKKCICENSKQQCHKYINGLNAMKSEILSDIRSGNICLPDKVLQEIHDGVEEKLNLISFLDGYF